MRHCTSCCTLHLPQAPAVPAHASHINRPTLGLCRYLEHVLAQLRAAGGRVGDATITQPLYWGLLQQLVAQGQYSGARRLLAAHALAAGAAAPAATAPEDSGLQVRATKLPACTASGELAAHDTKDMSSLTESGRRLSSCVR